MVFINPKVMGKLLPGVENSILEQSMVMYQGLEVEWLQSLMDILSER